GIINLDVKPNPEDATRHAIYTSVKNFSAARRASELELRFENQLVETRHLSIEPGQTSPQVFVASQNSNGVFSVHLTAKDDLTVDNDASISSLLPQPVKILLVSRGNRFL